MKKILLSLMIISVMSAYAKEINIVSPDGRNSMNVESDGIVSFSLFRDGALVVNQNKISLTVDGLEKGINAKSKGVKRIKSDRKVEVKVPRRYKELADNYNGAIIKYPDYDIEFRVYNDGAAYRFISTNKKSNEINAEKFTMEFPGNPVTYTQLTDRLQQWFEYNYTERHLSSLPSDSLIILPMLIDAGKYKVVLAESDVYDYPGLYLRSDSGKLTAQFANYPLTEKPVENGNKIYVDARADYLVANAGRRTFPWRVIAVADEEVDLLKNELVYLLASEPEEYMDFNWVKPGKVVWDWWNCWNIYNVDFKAGINTETYYYLIDYAAKNGVEYVLFDEGWSAPFDLLQLRDGVDMKKVCDYARQKNIGVLLWTKWVNLDRQMTEALDQMKEWGVKGIKVDFMDRNDAKMVEFYERTAQETAKREMLVNFHGSYPPDGMRRKYPNIMTREGVYGLENNKWSNRVTPRHDVLLSYIRQFSGPMDYTPGAMLNAHPDKFRYIHDEPMSQGTRSHQVALYILFESPLQTMADSPVHYDLNPQSRDFIKQIPTVWDETVPLAGKLGEYVAVARKYGDKWYVGAINGTNEPLHIEVNIDFIKGVKNIEYHIDGINSDRQAKDFKQGNYTEAGDILSIEMARGGGYAAIITTK
ncbi:MAG: glycoside hydrolase family 97 protein [Bacteroides sp.]|nr:glycoside hydrolase family 97 protein [Bacteroides sp.]